MIVVIRISYQIKLNYSFVNNFPFDQYIDDASQAHKTSSQPPIKPKGNWIKDF